MSPKFTFSCTIAASLLLAPVSGVADVIDIMNSIRSQGCAELPAVDQRLRARAQLEEAARRIARGDGLETAIAESGYRARKSASIRIRQSDGDRDVAQILEQRFCNIVADESLREAGVFRRNDEIWIVLATPAAPPQEEDPREASLRVIELVNEARAQSRRCGRKKFQATSELRRAIALERAARTHAQDISGHNLRGHKGSDGSTPAERVTRAGYSWASVAENVAGGQRTAEEVVETWLASPGHCANLMDPRYSETGVARATNRESEHVVYWVQVFAAPE